MDYSSLESQLPYKSKNNTMNTDQQYASFSKNQENISHNGTEYYCGGNSSLAIGGLQMDNTPVSDLYFSKENMQRLQKQIKKEILRESNGKFNLINDQDEMDLLIAMRAVYLDNSRNLPTHVVSQVKELNRITIDYIVPDMMTNIKQQSKYLKDINGPIPTMDRPLNVNRAGRKTLPSSTTIWGF